MLTRATQTGVTLIELMIAVAIFALLVGMALPSYRDWIQNSHIRSGAESIQNGLQLARGEAVRRNTTVTFVLTDDAPTTANAGTVTASTTGGNWVVRAGNTFIQAGERNEGYDNLGVAASAATLTFNSLGRAGAAFTADLTNPTGGACANADPSGPMRCLRVQVSSAGSVRLCDPNLGAGEPQGCS